MKQTDTTYNDTLDADDQITMEENIASIIFHTPGVVANEETAQALGQEVLRVVLLNFRPDFFK